MKSRLSSIWAVFFSDSRILLQFRNTTFFFNSVSASRISSSFIASWTSAPLPDQQRQSIKNQFIGVSVSSFLISGVSAFMIGGVFIHLSNSLHNSMLKRVARAPMQFFNSNPLGRILNRFSKDTALTDSILTTQFLMFL